MEGELWKEIHSAVRALGKGRGPRRHTYTDADIALVFLWAVLHERPMTWALDPRHWRSEHRRPRLPSTSTLSERLRTAGVQHLLRQIEARWRPAAGPGRPAFWIDAKPLPIGGCSGDREAHAGWCAGGMGRGYKLYAIAEKTRGLLYWVVRPMNVNETKVAPELIERLEGPGYLVGDREYDVGRLHDVAAARGLQLVASRQRLGRKLGHRPHSPYRRKGLALLERPLGRPLIHDRYGIDRFFEELISGAGGLAPLPAWVRGLRRVENWVRGKTIIFHLKRWFRLAAAA